MSCFSAENVRTVGRYGGILVGATMTANGLFGLADPRRCAQAFGLLASGATVANPDAPIDAQTNTVGRSVAASEKEADPSPWIPIFAVRNLAFGLVALGLAGQCNWRSLGLLYLACTPIAWVDFWEVYRRGQKQGKQWQHLVGGFLIPGVGLAMNAA